MYDWKFVDRNFPEYGYICPVYGEQTLTTCILGLHEAFKRIYLRLILIRLVKNYICT